MIINTQSHKKNRSLVFYVYPYEGYSSLTFFNFLFKKKKTLVLLFVLLYNRLLLYLYCSMYGTYM